MGDWAHSRRLGIPADEAGSVVLRQPPASKLANLFRIAVRDHALGLVTQQLGGRVLPRQESFASLHILTRPASEGSEAFPSLARRVRMSFFGARVITEHPPAGRLGPRTPSLREGPGSASVPSGSPDPVAGTGARRHGPAVVASWRSSVYCKDLRSGGSRHHGRSSQWRRCF